jgi:hypothetical protein
MNFTQSKDGEFRVSIQVTHRLTPREIAIVWIMRHWDYIDTIDLPTSKAQLLANARRELGFDTMNNIDDRFYEYKLNQEQFAIAALDHILSIINK